MSIGAQLANRTAVWTVPIGAQLANRTAVWTVSIGAQLANRTAVWLFEKVNNGFTICRGIQNPAKHLRWSFVRKQLTG